MTRARAPRFFFSPPRLAALAALSFFVFVFYSGWAHAQKGPVFSSGSQPADQQNPQQRSNPDRWLGIPSDPNAPIDGVQGKKLNAGEISRSGSQQTQADLPKDFIPRLEDMLRQGRGVEAANLLAKVGPDTKIDQWLEGKAQAGIVPMMWILAQRLEREQPQQASKWVHAGLFGLWQEREICLDNDTEFAPDAFIRAYPKAYEAARRNPIAREASIAFAFTLLEGLGNRMPPPIWLCMGFANSKHPATAPYLREESAWADLREKGRDKIRKRLNLPSAPKAPKVVPKQASPLEQAR